MLKEPTKTSSYLPSFLVLLALICAFFLGSLNPFIPKPSTPRENSPLEFQYADNPQVDVWLSKDKLFVWNREIPRPLDELPARIEEFKTHHTLQYASISGEELTRYETMVFALSELKKGGFRSVTVETRTKPIPSPR
jgi:biopolymer transport protein ExbD